MTRLLTFLLLAVMSLAGPAAAAGSWEGTWQVAWPNGGGFINLTQRGSAVTGSYSSGYGRVEAQAQGGLLTGELVQEHASESFTAILGPDGTTFSGQTESGSWLSGFRAAAASGTTLQQAVDLSTPRSTMRSFLHAGNLARAGEFQALAWAVDTIDFGGHPEWASLETRPAAAEELFEAVDLATFSLSMIPERTAAPMLNVSLPRLDGGAPIKLELSHRGDGAWRIRMPSAEALLAVAGTSRRPADAFRQLQNPRDTVRSFLEGMAKWQDGGSAQALATINIANVSEVLKTAEGELMAQYIVRILDRVGHLPLQSIPNSGASREPFVLFAHPEGRIFIEPFGAGADAQWKFSVASAQSLRRLHRAVDRLPEAHTLDSRLIPWSPMFWLRDRVKAYAPGLLADVSARGRLEIWQLMAALTCLAVLILLTATFARIALWLLIRPAVKNHVSHPRRLATAVGVGLAAGVGTQLMPIVGMPAGVRQYTVPVVGSLLLLVAAYAAWKLLMAFSSILQKYTEQTETALDNILLTFGTGVARLVLLAAVGLTFGHLWSLPTTGLLAGLGIGGLAVAFASKETLANLFGAGILLGDRPFRTGDRIIAGDVNGWVEEVGLRSTRIRTLHDSVMVVPNGKLADMPINNLGARRRRNLMTTVTVTGGSTPEKITAFTQAIFNRVDSDPDYLPNNTEVNITAITATGIVVEVSATFHSKSGWLFRKATHQLLLDILNMAQTHGLTLGRGTHRLSA